MLIHKAILKLIGAASRDDARYQLSGIHVEEDGDKVRACATNGKILAIVVHEKTSEDDFPTKVNAVRRPVKALLPRSFVDKVSRIVKAAGKPIKPIFDYLSLRQITDETVEAEVIDNDIESTRITGTMIDGKYPDYGFAVKKPKEGLTVRLNPALLLDGAKLLNDLVKELGAPAEGAVVYLDVSEEVAKDGHVSQPIHLTYKSPDGIEAKVLVMPLIMKS